MTAPYWLNIHDPTDFPDASLALTEPDGLLAIGGDLTVKRLLTAYSKGIFPWYNEDQPILWWSPDPRAVLFPEHLKISRSLRKTLHKHIFRVSFDMAFDRVIQACAAPRPKQSGTWISDEMQQAYQQLHQQGYAHSVECWQDAELVGGLYGVAIGKIFFGESMFSRVTDASKIAFVYLVKHLQAKGFSLIDCQVSSAHLESLGAIDIPRTEFTRYLAQYCGMKGWDGQWGINAAIEQQLLA
jgi:leucyl/phenylalanyl-tRNA--protein transferase